MEAPASRVDAIGVPSPQRCVRPAAYVAHNEYLKLVAAVLCQGELCAQQGALVVQDFVVRGNPAAKALQGSGDGVAEIFHRNFLRYAHLVILLVCN
jgi:hypothetical protein